MTVLSTATRSELPWFHGIGLLVQLRPATLLSVGVGLVLVVVLGERPLGLLTQRLLTVTTSTSRCARVRRRIAFAMSKSGLGMVIGLGCGLACFVSGCGSIIPVKEDGGGSAGGAGGARAGNGGAGGAGATGGGGTGGAVDAGGTKDATAPDTGRDAAPPDTGRDAAPLDTGRDATPPDAGRDATAPDSGIDAPTTTCDVSQPFGTLVLVPGVNQDSSNDTTGRLTSDELTIFFASDRSGSGSNDLYTATRTSRTASFGTPQLVAGVNTSSADGFPSVTADALNLFFESSGPGTYDVYVASRTSTAAQFSTPSLVPNVDSNLGDAQPYILADGSALYFMSFRPGVGDADIWRSSFQPGAGFAAPVIVSTINTPSPEYAATPTADELAIYWASNRADSPAKGSFDIWMAKRASRTASFDPPVNVQELNTSGLEEPNWISPDKCRLYFTRFGATGYKIFVASRSP